MIAIQTAQLSKFFGHYRVIEELSLEIPTGECFALFGANGAGKTTLLRILATLNRPSSGSFQILGYDGNTEKELIRGYTMFLAHGSHLYDDLNPFENLRFSMAMRGESTTDRQIKLALDQVDIGAFGDMKTRYFSAGMKKRLALAKAILAHPKVLLLDEPYNALDTSGVNIMNEFIRGMVKNDGTVLMTTHDRDKASQVSRRAGFLSKGSLQILSDTDLKHHDFS